MKYYSAIRKKTTDKCKTQVNLKNILSKRSLTQKSTHYMSPVLRNSKTGKINLE